MAALLAECQRERSIAAAAKRAAAEPDQLVRAVGKGLVATTSDYRLADRGTGRGYRSPAWALVASLRAAAPELTDLDVDDAYEALRPALSWVAEDAGWDGTGNPLEFLLPHSDSFEHDADPIEDFIAVWGRYGKRGSTLEQAAERAEQWGDAEAFGPELARPLRAPFRRFLALCAELSAVVFERDGSPVFYLPRRAVADHLKTDHKTVSRWRREAEDRGLLRLHAEARGRMAAEYVWCGTVSSRDPAPPKGAEILPPHTTITTRPSDPQTHTESAGSEPRRVCGEASRSGSSTSTPDTTGGWRKDV